MQAASLQMLKKGILVFKEENEKVQIRIVDLLMASYKAENMLLQRAAKDVKSTTLQRHTGTFQAFLSIH